MCGITGKIYFNDSGNASEQEVHRMSERIQHRGPDDQGVYVNPSRRVGLGHRRLSIIDLSPAGHQPMTNEDGTVWIVFNGEIYNFQRLRADLQAKGHQFKSNTDTETIIHLWEEVGEQCVRYLRGMFSFAIWDENQRKLFLARDRVGKKPLKYYHGKDFFVFASELKAFLPEPGVPREIDDVAVHHYLTFQYVPHPATGFKHIKKLPAAHYLVIDLSKNKPVISEPTRYWQLDYTSKLNYSEEEWKERIKEKLKESVKIRLISDVPLGAFLSGGVDSSAIVAMMAEMSSQPVKTFSIGFDDEKTNELPYARMIAERYHTDHHEFIVEPNAIEVLSKLVYHYEEPYGDSSALPSTYLSQMTRNHVTVTLNGDGGDENFAGYPWTSVLKLAALYQKTPALFRKINQQAVDRLFHYFPRSYLLRYGKIYTQGSLTSPAYHHTELLSYFSIEEKKTLYRPEFLTFLQQFPTWKFLNEVYADHPTLDPVDLALLADIQCYLADDLLPKVDIATMAVSLESRSPLLDHEFMELAAKIPSRLKIKHGKGKYIFKEAMRSHLPPDILFRKKQGFGIPLDRWFRTSLLGFAKMHLLSNALITRRFIDPSALELLFRRHQEGAREGRKIWLLLTLELWLRRFFPSL